MFDEEIVATQNSIIQESVVGVEDGKIYSDQQCVKLEVYLR